MHKICAKCFDRHGYRNNLVARQKLSARRPSRCNALDEQACLSVADGEIDLKAASCKVDADGEQIAACE